MSNQTPTIEEIEALAKMGRQLRKQILWDYGSAQCDMREARARGDTARAGIIAKRMRRLEQSYCELVTGLKPGNVARFRLAADPSKSYVGIVRGFRFNCGGEVVIMQAELIRQRYRKRTYKEQDFHLCLDPEHLPEIVDDEFPEFVEP